MEGWFWVTLGGLVLDIVGVAYLTAGLFISKEGAVELTATRFAGETLEENLRHPAAQDRLRQSRRAALGLLFLVLGFGLQAVGSGLSAST